MAVQSVRPDVDDFLAWTIVGGDATQFAAINDSPDNDATYIRNPGTVSQAQVGLANPSVTGTQRIKQARIRMRQRFTGAGSVRMGLIRFGLIEPQYWVRSSSISTNFLEIAGPYWTTDGQGNEWDRSDLASVRIYEYGSAADRVRISEVWVDWDVRSIGTFATPTVAGLNSSRPTTSWVWTANADGDQIAAYAVKIFAPEEYNKVGFDPETSRNYAAATGPNAQDLDFVTGNASSWQADTDLQNGVAYRSYVKLAQDFNGNLWWTAWQFVAATTAFTTPNTPDVTRTIDDAKARVLLDIFGRNNLLTEEQASFEGGTTVGWAAVGTTTIANNGANAAHGTKSMSMTRTGTTGQAAAQTPTGASGIPVAPSTAFTVYAQFKTAVTARTCRVLVNFFDAAGASTGTAITGNNVTDSAANFNATSTASGTTPAAAAFASVVVQVDAAVVSEVHFVDKIGLWPGTGGTWGPGGSTGDDETLTLVEYQDSYGPNLLFPNIADGGDTLESAEGFYKRTAADLLDVIETSSWQGCRAIRWGPSAAGSVLDIGMANSSPVLADAPLAAPNKAMVVSGYFRLPSGSSSFTLKAQARDSSGALVGSAATSGSFTPTSAWAPVATASFTPPDTAIYLQVWVENTGSTTTLQLQVDGLQAELGTARTPWGPGRGSRDTWTVHRDGAISVMDNPTRQYRMMHDHEVPRGEAVRLWRISNTAMISGSQVASAYVYAAAWQTPDGTWWLKDPLNLTHNVQTDNDTLLVRDSIAEELAEDATTVHPIGRSHPVVVSDWISEGLDGTLEFFTEGEAAWGRLYDLLRLRTALLVQWPNGGSKYARLGKRGITRSGATPLLRRSVSVDYVETEPPSGTSMAMGGH